jgi:hypothetical protein
MPFRLTFAEKFSVQTASDGKSWDSFLMYRKSDNMGLVLYNFDPEYLVEDIYSC